MAVYTCGLFVHCDAQPPMQGPLLVGTTLGKRLCDPTPLRVYVTNFNNHMELHVHIT